jgi:DNA-binding HxlR family transcriptional regulator
MNGYCGLTPSSAEEPVPEAALRTVREPTVPSPAPWTSSAIAGRCWSCVTCCAAWRYFDEFLRAPEGIATNVLSARLRALCEWGLVEKTPDPSDQRRYTYRLSDDGLHLGELLGDIAAWGLKYLPGTRLWAESSRRRDDHAGSPVRASQPPAASHRRESPTGELDRTL